MNGNKAQLTVTVDRYLAAYAEQLVTAGKAESVSAVINAALEEKADRDREALTKLRALASQADPEKVERMKAHVDRQLAQLQAHS